MTRNLLPRGTTILLLALASLAIGTRPVVSQDATAKVPEFEAVTIKLSDRTDPGGAWGVNKNEYFARNIPFAQVILQAYLGFRPSMDRMQGAPAWVTTDRYFVTAKADDATADSWKGLRQAQQTAIVAPLLRRMLEDRCKLVTHTVPTELQGYALVLGKHPLKLKERKPDAPMPKPKSNYGIFEGGSMIISTQRDDPFPSTTYLKFTLAQLIEFINGGGPPIVDQTGLTGTYDLTLPRLWSPPPPQPEGSASPTVPVSPPDIAHLYDWESVGLEMKPIKVPGVNLVIDHIERPSEN